MQSQKRTFLKYLALSGFSLYFPACSIKKIQAGKSLPVDTRDALEKALESNNVIYLQKTDNRYQRSRKSYNLMVEKFPQIIALCKNTEGVAEAVQLANAKDWKVAIKSGGHSFEGFSSINDGLQINLSLMNAIQWENETRVMMQPACLLKDIYAELLPKQRLLPAGSCGTVGVAGLTLGGGYGFFSRKYGLTCDHLLEATLVDGKGQIHTTRSGDELMWALKGGGNGNFGVVTEFKFQTHEAPDGFTRYRFKAFRLDRNKARAKLLLKKYFEYSALLSETCFAAFVLNNRTLTLLITNYGTPNQALDDMIAAFQSIMDRTSIGTKQELAKSLRSYYGRPNPLRFQNASAGYYRDYAHIEPMLEEVLEVVLNTKSLIFQLNTLGGKINSPAFETHSCYPHRAWPFLSELQAYFDDTKTPDALMKAFIKVQNIVYDKGIRTQYRNYPYLGFKDWETAYYGENYTKLQQLKALYDPNNLFSYEQSIKPPVAF